MPIELLLGFAIGVTLGLFGGGGSILTVPALVYVMGNEPRAAVTASLAIVGLNSLSGMWLRRSQGGVNWRVAASFGAAGMLASFATSQISKQFAGSTLLIAFSVLMLVVGASMLLLRPPQPRAQIAALSPGVLAAGAGVGALTGMLGVGGGFLIVPALVAFATMDVYRAVGTSLLVMTLVGAAAVATQVASGRAIPLDIAAGFVGGGIPALFVGSWIGRRVGGPALARVFAVAIVLVAALIVFKTVTAAAGPVPG